MSNRSEISSENYEMSCIAEATALIRRAAEPRPVGDSVKSAIRRASVRAGLTFTRAKSIWYGEAHRIDANEMDALRKLASRYASIAETLRHQDEDFYRTQADALEYWANRLSSFNRARD